MSDADWTTGPAKWFAVGVLGLLAAGSLTWSTLRADAGSPLRVALQANQEPPRATLAPGASEPVASPAAPAPHQASRSTSSESTPSATLAKRININTAPAAELELLPGIGPALAQRIVEDRAARGAYRALDDLKRVRGIGPKIFERLKEHARID